MFTLRSTIPENFKSLASAVQKPYTAQYWQILSIFLPLRVTRHKAFIVGTMQEPSKIHQSCKFQVPICF